MNLTARNKSVRAVKTGSLASPLRTLSHPRNLSTQDLDKRKGDRERVVILGSGWSGFLLSRKLDKKKYQTVIVSPRSYFVFTPLLASTAVGTLEFRNAVESVRGRRANVEYIQGWADSVNLNENKIAIEPAVLPRPQPGPGPGHLLESGSGNLPGGPQLFDLAYDKLVVAVGCYSQTFNTKGVKENALFLKDVVDARKIRTRILECFEIAALPSSSDDLRRQILNFAIVGGGPTGVEFAAELFDLCNQDLKRIYPSLIPYVNITIYDVAPSILPGFDSNLAAYAVKAFKRDCIQVKTEHFIQELRKGLPDGSGEDAGCLTMTTKQDGDVGVGMLVWSTGLMMNPFVKKALSTAHIYPASSAIADSANSDSSSNVPTQTWTIKRDPKKGGIMVDEYFRIKLISETSLDSVTTNSSNNTSSTTSSPVRPATATMSNVFALGDVAIPESGPLPATAQVASQSASHLGKHLNALTSTPSSSSFAAFKYRDLGALTYVSGMRGIVQTGPGELTGWAAWVIWRGAYLTKTVSLRNKILIPCYWFLSWVLGRDISRF